MVLISILPRLMWMTDFSSHTANAGYRPSYYSLLMAIVDTYTARSQEFSQRFLSQANANIYARALHDSMVSRQGQWLFTTLTCREVKIDSDDNLTQITNDLLQKL
ncbi:hypothetical protein V8E54_012982 [Elaphomyces granulatus]